MWLIKAALLLVLALIATTGQAFDLRCVQAFKDLTPLALPTTQSARFDLNDDTQCQWLGQDKEPTASVLISVPPTNSPIEIEITSKLYAAGTTATHIALLDSDFRAVKWIPHSSFRERKKHLRVRFFLNPSDAVKYLLIGGASSATQDTLARTYTPPSTSVLKFLGVVTARELESDFQFVPTGEIWVGVRKPQKSNVVIAPAASQTVAAESR